jgi:hypothetical protein
MVKGGPARLAVSDIDFPTMVVKYLPNRLAGRVQHPVCKGFFAFPELRKTLRCSGSKRAKKVTKAHA